MAQSVELQFSRKRLALQDEQLDLSLRLSDMKLAEVEALQSLESNEQEHTSIENPNHLGDLKLYKEKAERQVTFTTDPCSSNNNSDKVNIPASSMKNSAPSHMVNK